MSPSGSSCPDRSRSTPARRRSGSATARTAARCRCPSRTAALRAVNVVGLEAYLYGVVPSEMPRDWLPEALKAQAVAARSYALAVKKSGSWFDLYPDTRSQVYLGIAHEAPSTTAAVQDTAGQVVLYDGPRGDDVLLLELRRPHVVRLRGLAELERRSVSRVGQRPVRHDLALPPVGPVRRSGVTAAGASSAFAGPVTDVTMQTGPSGRVQSVTAIGSQGDVDDDRLGSPPRAEPSLDVVPDRHALARHPAGAGHVRQERRAERRRAQAARRCGSTSGSPGLRGSRFARSRLARAAR